MILLSFNILVLYQNVQISLSSGICFRLYSEVLSYILIYVAVWLTLYGIDLLNTVYGASDSRSVSKSAVSKRTLAVLPCSSCRINKRCIENGHLQSATNKTSFVCWASSSGHRRNNPDFSRNNKHGFRGRNRRNEDKDGLVDGGLEDDMLSSKNGPLLSLSSFPKFQAT